MKIAFYKSAEGRTFNRRFVHWITCLVTNSNYSHVELVINDISYSSSISDKGVRSKVIPFTPDRWDVYEVIGDEQFALQKFNERRGNAYDDMGVLKFIFPFLKSDPNKDFCSELVANMLGITGDRISPEVLLQLLKEQGRLGELQTL